MEEKINNIYNKIDELNSEIIDLDYTSVNLSDDAYLKLRDVRINLNNIKNIISTITFNNQENYVHDDNQTVFNENIIPQVDEGNNINDNNTDINNGVPLINPEDNVVNDNSSFVNEEVNNQADNVVIANSVDTSSNNISDTNINDNNTINNDEVVSIPLAESVVTENNFTPVDINQTSENAPLSFDNSQNESDIVNNTDVSSNDENIIKYTNEDNAPKAILTSTDQYNKLYNSLGSQQALISGQNFNNNQAGESVSIMSDEQKMEYAKNLYQQGEVDKAQQLLEEVKKAKSMAA